MPDTDDFERLYRTLGLDQAAAVGSTIGLAGAPTMVSGSKPRATSGGGTPLTQSLPRLEIATPQAAREGAAPTGDDHSELTPIEVLGEGGMGQVLVARQWSLEREVAVKVLHRDASDEAARNLVDEARITGALEHPGVVPIYALARDGKGLPAVVMKRVEGISWAELLRDAGHPAWARVAPLGKDRLEAHVGILMQVCNALAFAHRRGVLHRDLKPANVLVGELGEVFLADWGIAVRKGQGGEQRLVGTPAYMAPEMVHGEAERVDERTDVYLIGATLFEVLTGLPPHESSDVKEALQHAWRSPPPTFPASVSSELAALVTRALAQRPEDRPPTALEVRDALQSWLSHRGSVRLTESAGERLKLLEAARARGDGSRVHELLSECRFAFTQALREWPENAAAKANLERAVTLGVEHELAAGNAAAARVLLADLPNPPRALVADVAAGEEKDAARKRNVERLEQRERLLDPKVAARERNRLLLAMGGTVAVMFTVLRYGGLREELIFRVGNWFRVVPMLILVTVMGVGVFIGRRSLLATTMNRQLLGTFAVGSLGVIVMRVVTIAGGISIPLGFAIDCVLLATALAVCALFTHWSFILVSGVFLCGAAVSYLFPDVAVTAFSVSGILAFVVSVIAWRFWLRALAKQGT